jgi:hypothetical protein
VSPRGSADGFTGSFGASEEVLTRLEKGVRAQRERLIARSVQSTALEICPNFYAEEEVSSPPTSPPEICPNLYAEEEAKQVSSPPMSPQAASCTQDVTRRAPERRGSSGTIAQHNSPWSFNEVDLIAIAITAFAAGTLLAPRLLAPDPESTNFGAPAPAQVISLPQRELPSTPTPNTEASSGHPNEESQNTKPVTEAEGQPLAGFTCYSSASAVRQGAPDAWPSWTLRAPGHEGIRCWYATTRAAAHDRHHLATP